MSQRLVDVVALIDRTICGPHIVVPVNAASPLWLVLVNILLLAGVLTISFGCIVAAIWMLIRPGERNPDHPKYRILNADR